MSPRHGAGVQVPQLAAVQAFYQFETSPGFLADSGPNGWSLTDNGGVSVAVTGREGLFGWQGASGVTSRRTLGNQPRLMGPLVSVEGWFKWRGTDTQATAFSYLNPNTAETPWRLQVGHNFVTGNTTITYRVFTNAAGVNDLFAFTQAADRLWHHVAVTYDAAGQATLFVDAVPVAQVAAPVTPLTITSDAANLIQITGGDYQCDNLAMFPFLLSAADVQDHAR